MICKAAIVAVVFSALALLIASSSTVCANTISVSTDVLNGGNAGAGNLGDNSGSLGAQVNRVSFIPNGSATLATTPYNRSGGTIDVSAYVDPSGNARGNGQGIDINSYPGVVGGSNLYLSGQPNSNNPGFGAHANWLVTVDLNVIRAADFTASTDLVLTGTFGAFGGIQPGSPASAGGNITGGIYLDGAQRDVMQSSFSPPINPTFDITIPASAHYLTFTILNIPSSSFWDDGLFENTNLTPTPEPSTLILFGLGAIGLFFARRRNFSSAPVGSSPVLKSLVIAAVILAGLNEAAFAGGVSVGSSTLIDTLDYSDSFTLTANGGEAGRNANAFPLSTVSGGAGLAIENTYANPAQNWTDGQWSISSDSTVINGSPSYPGSSGAGSSTGMTQAGLNNGGNFNGGNFEVYGLNYAPGRSNYVAQFDAVQTTNWIDITSSSVPNSITGANSLSVLFRQGGIGIYSALSGETAVPVASTGLTVGTWNNYAVDFDHDDNTLSIYVNQVLKATVNLATFDGGAYAGYSNAAISFGGASGGGDTRLWTDNVQIGAVPEPSTWIMAMISLVGMLGIARRKR